MARPAGDQDDSRDGSLIPANRGRTHDHEESQGQSTEQHGDFLRRCAKVTIDGMTQEPSTVVSANKAAAKLPDGVLDLAGLEPVVDRGCRVFVHYNGPTDQLSGLCAGMAVLDPGASPHPPHRHPEEEFLIIAEGTGEIECAGKVSQVGPGAIMYCAGDVLHGITNTGKVPLTFYWSKWLAK
jgi:mannose-6-phosphate isomerase-like protein (cupin superfamily)